MDFVSELIEEYKSKNSPLSCFFIFKMEVTKLI